MTDSQLVSVLMPCYRESAKDFTEALASILKQTYHRIEVVVVLIIQMTTHFTILLKTIALMTVGFAS